MKKEQSSDLEQQFLRLLEEIDPNLKKHPDLALSFSNHLVAFTEQWASDRKNIEKHEAELVDWIMSNSPPYST